MPEEATISDIEELHLLSWQLGLKAVAVYRDNCKVGQPLSTAKKEGAEDSTPAAASASQVIERIVEHPADIQGHIGRAQARVDLAQRQQGFDMHGDPPC